MDLLATLPSHGLQPTWRALRAVRPIVNTIVNISTYLLLRATHGFLWAALHLQLYNRLYLARYYDELEGS